MPYYAMVVVVEADDLMDAQAQNDPVFVGDAWEIKPNAIAHEAKGGTKMTDPQVNPEVEGMICAENYERGEEITTAIVYAAIKTHPDAYPFAIKMLNQVLLAGIEADTIGGSEPDILRRIAHAIKAVLIAEDKVSSLRITAV